MVAKVEEPAFIQASLASSVRPTYFVSCLHFATERCLGLHVGSPRGSLSAAVAFAAILIGLFRCILHGAVAVQENRR